MEKPLSLEAFLYVLLRDHLTSGETEKLLHDAAVAYENGATFSNEHLHAYVNTIAERFVIRPANKHSVQIHLSRSGKLTYCGLEIPAHLQGKPDSDSEHAACSECELEFNSACAGSADRYQF